MQKFNLSTFTTPVQKLERLTRELDGPAIYCKRDDLLDLAFGGNKIRKLEYLVADALAKECDLLITAGAGQSNHCRLTAAAAIRAGMECHLVMNGTPPENVNGNLLLDKYLNTTLHWTSREKRNEMMQTVAKECKSEGYSPYVIPVGGSNAIGAYGYLTAMQELLQQLEHHIDVIVVASSSGGTHAGLLAGARLFGFKGRILGIRIDKDNKPEDTYPQELCDLAMQTARLAGKKIEFKPEEIELENNFLGEGYGLVGDLERQSIELFARTEAIFLDPVYTGRAAGAMLDLIEQQVFSRKQRVLFWHTGGSPALFAYTDALIGDV